MIIKGFRAYQKIFFMGKSSLFKSFVPKYKIPISAVIMMTLKTIMLQKYFYQQTKQQPKNKVDL